MKIIKQLTLLAFLTVINPLGLAADIQVAVVDTERILRESAPALRAGKRLENEFEPRKKNLLKLSDKLKKLQQDDKFSDPTKREQEREFVRVNQDFQRLQLEFNEDMTRRRNEELNTLNATVTKAIETLAEKENIDLVLQEAVYRSKRIDITDKVLKYLSDK